MGGNGSTRWGWHTKKDTVEACRVLSIFDLKRENVLEADTKRFGSWAWWNAFTKERTARIGYELNTLNVNSYFRVYYTVTAWDGRKSEYDYKIGLQKTTCYFGGVRWWFLCPLSINGHYCGQRVGKLYLPPGGRYYGCRHCYDLTYRSSQENDKRVNALKRLGPLTIMQGMNSGEIDWIKGLKALPDEIWR